MSSSSDDAVDDGPVPGTVDLEKAPVDGGSPGRRSGSGSGSDSDAGAAPSLAQRGSMHGSGTSMKFADKKLLRRMSIRPASRASMTQTELLELSDSDEAAAKEALKDTPFSMTADALKSLTRNKDAEALQAAGGVDRVCEAVAVDPAVGISDESFDERIATFGDNTYPEPPHKNFLELIWEALKDLTMIILIVLAAIATVLGLVVPHDEGGGWYEGVSIFVAVIIVTLVTAANDYSKEKQFRDLNAVKNDKKVLVLRSGKEQQVSIFTLMPGDICLLDTGDQVPADGLFLDGHDLSVDESSLTGEPDSMAKNEEVPFLFSGCQVTDGTGRMIVTCTGIRSAWGEAMLLMTEEADDTPLEEKLDHMAVQIGKVGLAVAIVVFLALTIIWIVEIAGTAWQWSQLGSLVDFAIIAVTIVVVAVPEGLPLAVTISLAYSMKQMLTDNNLVRRLAACETMGGATNICSDKTGTLTENRMKVRRGWVAKSQFDLDEDSDFNIPEVLHDLLAEGVAVNSKAYVNMKTQQRQERGSKAKVDFETADYIGNKTECALLLMTMQLGVDNYRDIRKSTPVLNQVPFSSARKRMTTVVADKGGDGFRLHCKGAAEIVLGLCTSYVNADGKSTDLDKGLRKEMEELIDEMASQGLRTIVLGYRQTKSEDDVDEDGLSLLALVGITDPVRAEVPAAVLTCQQAGIFVRMVTGDNIKTAEKIARDCGILTDGKTIEGPDFEKLSEDELKELIPNLQVLARSSPQDKHTLVTQLRAMGEVVAVTGDGTNDAPALRAADVGLAMGIEGTDVAKEACDVVIMDDNFTSIEKTVLWGRSVYDNIRKFLCFQLTVNISALIIAFLGAVTLRGTPLKTIQLLWVNLIMDSMAALALGTEKPTPDLMTRMPYGRDAPLISRLMWRNILLQGFWQVVILLLVLYGGHMIWDVGPQGEMGVHHYTLVFNTFVWLQIFNEINCRKVYFEWNIFQNMHTNWMFLVILLITVVLQVLLVEFGQPNFAGTSGLTVGQHFACAGIGALSIPVGLLIRLIPVPLSELDRAENPNKHLRRQAKSQGEDGDSDVESQGSSVPLRKQAFQD